MSKAIPYLIQGKNIILVVDNKSHTISRDTHLAYGKIVDALKAQDWEALRDLVEPKKAIVNFAGGHVSITDNKINWKGQPFHNSLATRMIEMFQEGFPIDPMVRFMENLMANPSKRSVDQLYGFLEKNKLPITEDGYFLAFKRVRKDFKDIHSGTFDNSVGQTVEMERNGVDDNPDQTCSSGLHFCSESYLGHFGSADQPVMILKISPTDVVSIPSDYNGAKGRCCKYEVVAQLGVGEDPSQAFNKCVNADYPAPAPKVEPPKKGVQAKPPAAPAAKAQPQSPAAAWPFPTGNKPHATDVYDLVKVNGGQVVEIGLTKAAAEAKIAKNKAQKKVQLKMVKTN